MLASSTCELSFLLPLSNMLRLIWARAAIMTSVRLIPSWCWPRATWKSADVERRERLKLCSSLEIYLAAVSCNKSKSIHCIVGGSLIQGPSVDVCVWMGSLDNMEDFVSHLILIRWRSRLLLPVTRERSSNEWRILPQGTAGLNHTHTHCSIADIVWHVGNEQVTTLEGPYWCPSLSSIWPDHLMIHVTRGDVTDANCRANFTFCTSDELRVIRLNNKA